MSGRRRMPCRSRAGSHAGPRSRGGGPHQATIRQRMTGFAFRAVPPEPDHPALEQRVLERWERERTFERLRELREGGPPFSFFDGPITANNPMGVHHAWGRSLKDLFQRYQASLGKELRYQNGFDCQGLWVEVEVEKALGLNSKRDIETYGLERFVRACRDRVAEYSGVQTRQSERLGMWMDWERSYFTMTDPNISYIWGFLQECHERGWLYRGHRPMVWCARCGTSLSQHEVTATDSYRDVVHTALTVRFRLLDARRRAPPDLDDDALDAARERRRGGQPDGDLRARRRPIGARYIVAADRVEARVRRARAGRRRRSPAPSSSAGRTRPASTTCPCSRASSTASSPGTTSRSTRAPGVVHIAPGCGAEDFELGVRDGLPVLTPVDDAGAFYDGYGWLHGVHTHEATERIVDHLGRDGWLFREEPYPHRYPVCWRCGTELIFRVVDEWFISCDEMRQPMIDANAHGRVDARRTTASAWRTGCATWATGASRASATGACRCRSTSARTATSRSSGARRSCSSARPQGIEGLRGAAPAVDRPGPHPLRRVRGRGRARARGRRLLARRGHRARSRRSATAATRTCPRASPPARAWA